MTLAEFMENGFNAIDTGLLSLSVYLTIVSGYLVVAYIAGEKLSRFQTYTISFLFVSFAFIVTLSTFASFLTGMTLLASVGSPGDFVWLSTTLEVGAYVVALLQIAGIGLSLKFMADERKKDYIT